MKIPSEAELIEMEQRALCLPHILEYLDRKAEALDRKADYADSDDEEVRLRREYNRVQKAYWAIDGLSSDLDVLIEIVRAGVVYAR